MKTRVLTSIAIILAVLYPISAGGLPLQILGALIILCASTEWLGALPGFGQWKWKVLPMMVIWLLALPFVPVSWTLGWWAFGLLYFWSLPVFWPDVEEKSVMGILSFQLIMGVCWLSMQLFMNQPQYLWTLCFATYGSDTGAYFSGRFFGKHKLIERISPKKTWEGFFGGWLLGFVLSFGVSMLYSSSLNPWLNLAVCVLAPVFAELGDLCFSSFKRAYGIKDFSSILPGHGGVLDRVDSLLANILLFAILSSLILI